MKKFHRIDAGIENEIFLSAEGQPQRYRGCWNLGEMSEKNKSKISTNLSCSLSLDMPRNLLFRHCKCILRNLVIKYLLVEYLQLD